MDKTLNFSANGAMPLQQNIPVESCPTMSNQYALVFFFTKEKPHTALLKPKYVPKNPRMGDYVQKKGLGQGFNLIYVSAICLGGNLNKKSFFFLQWKKS